MTLTIEYSCGFHLQFTCINVAIHYAVAAKLEQVLGFDIAGYFSHNIGLVASDVAFDYAAGANHDLG